jgi:hypothetical protein
LRQHANQNLAHRGVENDFAAEVTASPLRHNRNSLFVQQIKRKANIIVTDGVAIHGRQNVSTAKYLCL